MGVDKGLRRVLTPVLFLSEIVTTGVLPVFAIVPAPYVTILYIEEEQCTPGSRNKATIIWTPLLGY